MRCGEINTDKITGLCKYKFRAEDMIYCMSIDKPGVHCIHATSIFAQLKFVEKLDGLPKSKNPKVREYLSAIRWYPPIFISAVIAHCAELEK